MKIEKLYLSLPISGHDEKERRRFAAMTSAWLMERFDGASVVNPFHVADRIKKSRIEQGNWDEPSYDEYMSADLHALRTCDAIVLCPGWHLSDGCMEEYRESLLMDIPIFHYDGHHLSKGNFYHC